jgi:hypothetical protein
MEEGLGKKIENIFVMFSHNKKLDERHIEFRSDSVPISDNTSKFMNYFALLVREHVPCTIEN